MLFDIMIKQLSGFDLKRASTTRSSRSPKSMEGDEIHVMKNLSLQSLRNSFALVSNLGLEFKISNLRLRGELCDS
ncbi:hypothetical protein HanIR_Chr15g0728951 [Helianthus annuus]|nr:hypothetical protein HanIR_Chr15g0728951 [Helianthus annuus]